MRLDAGDAALIQIVDAALAEAARRSSAVWDRFPSTSSMRAA
jgi:hypothetical protein